MNITIPTELSQSVDAMLSGLSLTIEALPDCPSIKLLLIDPSSIPQNIAFEDYQRIWNSTAYWAFCWASGQVLASHILSNTEKFKDKTILDFGAGSGVVAIAAAKVGAKHVIACDIDPITKQVCKFNAALNQVDLHWLEDIYQQTEQVDWLVAADVFYDSSNLVWLERFQSFAQKVLIADSRIKQWPDPSYRQLDLIHSNTVPDVGESFEFGQVKLFEFLGN